MHEELSAAPLLAWDQALLAPIFEINERMLERLHEIARASLPPASGTHGSEGAQRPADAPALILQLHREWCALDAAAQRRLAQCPYLLLDAGFAEPARWEAAGTLAVHEAAPPGAGGGHCYADPAWLALVRRTLLLGWHLARAHPLAARVLLGMCPASAAAIAASRLRDLEALAEQRAAAALPRWEQQPQVWRQLLRASHAPPPELLCTQLRGLQLLAAGPLPGQGLHA